MTYHQNQLQKRSLELEESAQMPFDLSDTQSAALEALYKVLTTERRLRTHKEALHDVFVSLYMEDQPLGKAMQTFTSPVAAYFALKCWDNLNGTFINVRDIPVALAKLQYSIRLRCFHEILSHNKLSSEEEASGNEWMR